MEDTIQELTNSFQSLKEKSVSVELPSKKDFQQFNYKKYSILGSILFILSVLIVVFFLDTKFYKQNDKIQYQYVLLDIFSVMLFLIIFYYSTKWVKKLLNNI